MGPKTGAGAGHPAPVEGISPDESGRPRQHDPCPPPLQQARLLDLPRASIEKLLARIEAAREAAAAANLPQSAPAAEAVAEVFAPRPTPQAKSPRKRKAAAWKSLPPAELAVHLLATLTIADSAWTTEPRLPRENRELLHSPHRARRDPRVDHRGDGRLVATRSAGLVSDYRVVLIPDCSSDRTLAHLSKPTPDSEICDDRSLHFRFTRGSGAGGAP